MALAEGPSSGCCGPGHGCVFAKALLAQAAECACSRRRSVGEQLAIDCAVPVAQANCSLLARLLHERARFALRLPPEGRPMMHAQALRLQCGGLAALQQLLEVDERDAHRLVQLAQQRHDGLTKLPWEALVAALSAWQAMRRRTRPPA